MLLLSEYTHFLLIEEKISLEFTVARTLQFELTQTVSKQHTHTHTRGLNSRGHLLMIL